MLQPLPRIFIFLLALSTNCQVDELPLIEKEEELFKPPVFFHNKQQKKASGEVFRIISVLIRSSLFQSYKSNKGWLLLKREKDEEREGRLSLWWKCRLCRNSNQSNEISLQFVFLFATTLYFLSAAKMADFVLMAAQ